MKTKPRSVTRLGLLASGLLAVALTGCRTHVVHQPTRTVYVPAPPPPPPPVVIAAPPAPAPQTPPPVVVAIPAEPPPVVVIQSESDFYAPLAAHGRWVVVGAYGRCWIPARVEAGWRPYANGYWQRTDAGWYWVSAEPWGWATYYYGRWDFHGQFGWIWVPQTQWAPAWVAWREGGGYVGWAPLRPAMTIGVNLGAANYEPAFASRAFVFVEHRRMLDPVHPRTVVVNNTTVINQTVNITRVKVVNNTVINEGPRPEVIERASGRKVQAVAAREFRQREEATIAARDRDSSTRTVKESELPGRPSPQAVQPSAARPRNGQFVERAPVVANPTEAVTPSARPAVVPAGRTPAGIEEARPARDGRARVVGNAQRDLPAAVEPKANPSARPGPAVLPRREGQSVGGPAVTAPSTPQPVAPDPIRGERSREIEVAKQSAVTPPAVTSRVKYEVRPDTRRQTKPLAKIDTAPPSSVKVQNDPRFEEPAAKRLIAPRGKSRRAEPAEANREGPVDTGPKQQGEARATTAVVSTRLAR